MQKLHILVQELEKYLKIKTGHKNGGIGMVYSQADAVAGHVPQNYGMSICAVWKESRGKVECEQRRRRKTKNRRCRRGIVGFKTVSGLSPERTDCFAGSPAGKITILPECAENFQILFGAGTAKGILGGNDQNSALPLQSKQLVAASVIPFSTSTLLISIQLSSVQSLSRVRLFVTP